MPHCNVIYFFLLIPKLYSVLTLFIFFNYSYSNLPPEISSKVQNIPISTDHGMQLYQHWVDQALGSIFAAFANKRLKTVPKHIANEFGVCSKNAKTIPFHAKCISQLLKNNFTGKNYKNFKDKRLHKKTRLELYSSKVIRQMIKQKDLNDKNKEWIGSFRIKSSKQITSKQIPSKQFQKFQKLKKLHKLHSFQKLKKLKKVGDVVLRAKRENKEKDYAVVKKNNYNLLQNFNLFSPLASVAKFLLNYVLEVKNKTTVRPWQQTIKRVLNVQDQKKKIKKHLERDSVEEMEQLSFRGLKKYADVGEDIDDIIDKPNKMKKFLEKKRKEKSSDPLFKLTNLFRDAVKLSYTLSGKNLSNLDDKNMKFVSPRFLSVVPEDDEKNINETIGFLSPSLFSIHNKGKGIENLTSLPNLLKGFSSRDQQEWMNLIIEAAEVDDHVDKIETVLKERKKKKALSIFNREQYEKESRTKDGTPLYFTKNNATKFGELEVRKIDVFETLEKSYTKEQIKELNRTGYTKLNSKQLNLIYGSNSPYNDSKALNKFLKINSSHLDYHIEKDIDIFSEMKSFKVRFKDIILSPVFMTPLIKAPAIASQSIILSPIVFSPIILSPGIFGPVVLSPWLFVPIILSPRLLSPLILSPFAISPVFLSPLVLHPVILSPGVLNPVILSPFVLTPVILSPLVLTPVILSPLLLSPFILSPASLSPLILSPFVLSPIIGSPQIINALVLSPYALSPILYTPLVAFTAILSPSWLS